MSDGENRLEADTRNELRGDPCGENDCHCKREVGQPVMDRAVAEDFLHVERDEEEHREERRAAFSREDQERVDLSFEVRATRMRSSSRR